MLSERKLFNQLLAVRNITPARFESTEEDYLESCSPGELVPFHKGAELRNIKVQFLDFDVLRRDVDSDALEGDHRKDSREKPH